jgi:mono/diheme cytochrome c family protein
MTSVQTSVKLRLALCGAATLAFVFSVQQAARLKSVHADSAAHSRGAELFATKGCAHCHGKDGVNGELGPDLQRVRNRLNAAQITKQIREGGKSMPAFGPDELTDEQVSDLVAYLRTKRKKFVPPPPPEPKAPVAKPDPDSGL